MKRRLLLTTAFFTGLAWSAPPAVTLVVELRWVERPVSGAAVAAARDGAVVVGTTGSVAPGPALSTQPAETPAGPCLLVLNGQTASTRLTSREPLQAVDAVVDLAPNGNVRGVHALAQAGERVTTRSFTVTPAWPGGRAPVRVSFSVDDDGPQWQSTLELPLERWQAVARTGGGTAPAPRGTLRSGDAAAPTERELQLRVSVQP